MHIKYSKWVIPFLLMGVIWIPANITIAQQLTGNKSSSDSPNVLIVGGGASHDFDRWFNLKDVKTLTEVGAQVRYTDQPKNILAVLQDIDILYLSNNQPLSDPELRRAIFNFVESGNDLLLAHAAIWYNWKDWPEYNKKLVGGGSRGHMEYGTFKVQVVEGGHPLMESVPATFEIKDELYRFEQDQEGSAIHVLAEAKEPGTSDVYPIIWTVDYGEGQIICMTLGHDKASHDHPAYKQILHNSINSLISD